MFRKSWIDRATQKRRDGKVILSLSCSLAAPVSLCMLCDGSWTLECVYARHQKERKKIKDRNAEKAVWRRTCYFLGNLGRSCIVSWKGEFWRVESWVPKRLKHNWGERVRAWAIKRGFCCKNICLCTCHYHSKHHDISSNGCSRHVTYPCCRYRFEDLCGKVGCGGRIGHEKRGSIVLSLLKSVD